MNKKGKNLLKFVFGAALLGIISNLISCNQADEGKKLAFKNCSSCHLFPEPDLLPKEIWKKSILPEMGFFLGKGGMDEYLKKKGKLDFYEQATFQQFYPEEPLVSDKEWELIQQYYLTNAPDSLKSNTEVPMETDLEKYFSIKEYSFDESPCATFVGFDEKYKEFYMATQGSEVRVYSSDFRLKQSLKAQSPVSYVERENEESLDLLMMGKMNPNNLPLGMLQKYSLSNSANASQLIADGLNRPVHFQKADFNKDGLMDYLVCSFGYYIGRLSWLEALPGGRYKEHYLNPISGSIKTVVMDLNKDGYDDFLVLMAQGNEGIYLYNNLKNGEFSQRTFVRVPPVYGSSDFAVDDFNNDGFPDLAIACGDNGDLSQIAKPYHGIHLFLNDGQWNFKEGGFLPVYGSTGLRVGDFDQDGDNDLAVIAYFSDFKKSPDRGFIFFENKGEMQFKGHISAKTDVGRWLVIDESNIDDNNSPDLILGSCITTIRDVITEKQEYWNKNKVSYLILKSKSLN